MHKKLLIGFCIISSIIFSFTFCFANDGVNQAVNGVKNVVNGAENTMGNAAKDISNMAKDATNNMEKGASETANKIGNTMMDNRNYNATRTSAEMGSESTFMGINTTTWTWIIVGISVAAIIALVWFFSTQKNNNHYND